MSKNNYRIKINGTLEGSWERWFDGASLTVQSGPEGLVTVIEGRGFDHAALFGLLAKIRDLNLILLEVTKVES